MEDEKIKKIKKVRNIIIFFILAIELIITIFILITWPHNNTSYSGSGMVNQEIEMYNARVKKYIGNSINGSDVKWMIEDIISQNNQNVGESGKFISIYAEDIKGYNREKELAKTNKKANVFENENAENNQVNIDETTKEYRKLSQKISSDKEYKVEAEYNDGRIYKVTIGEEER